MEPTPNRSIEKNLYKKSINHPTDFPREDHLRIICKSTSDPGDMVPVPQLTPIDANWRTSSLFSLPARLTRICTSSCHLHHLQCIDTVLTITSVRWLPLLVRRLDQTPEGRWVNRPTICGCKALQPLLEPFQLTPKIYPELGQSGEGV